MCGGGGDAYKNNKGEAQQCTNVVKVPLEPIHGHTHVVVTD